MKSIQLSEKYRIEKDSYSWVLIFNEARERKNKKTKELEEFIFEDKWYYPCIKKLLSKLIELDLKESKSIDEIIYKIDILEKKIDSLKDTIFNKKLANN